MKKYQNVSNDLVCVEFEERSQFLYTGQFITTDDTPKRIPRGVKVIDLTPVEEPKEEAEPEAKKVVSKPKASPRKKVKKS